MQWTAVPCAPEPGLLSEGPVWDAHRQELLWVDITAGLIHRGALIARADGTGPPDVAPLCTLTLDRPVGAVAPCASGDLIAAAGTGFLTVGATGRAAPFAAPSLPSDGVRRRMNDAKCDPRGRLLAGTMAYDITPGAGSLHRLDPDGSVATLLDSVTISNGLGWSPDGRRLYFADSATHRVDVFDYDPPSGALGSRRPFARFGADEEPDGLAVDTEGRVWVAVWGAGQVRAFAPDGTPYAVVDVPAAHVSSCAFAGPDLDVLVITTAREGRSPEQLRAEPDAGRLFVCRPGATGLPIAPFADAPAPAPASTPAPRPVPTGPADPAAAPGPTTAHDQQGAPS
ncbi:SMP-30/gluconolactonase/LRE family protein [Streptomyces sp. NBC_00335]|uniref:SMP-30/gluconolactonase/LRE family protein n=1 Tax=unclassified Streptomyces TaxID=2593676 RepID=UPI0022585661|nr:MULTISPECIES: SMP-30/gluconolactonase/LRE family protein [unclassified Streptomyces]MCX5408908.1 SMP-30/gluconolactonase/LRE family protein [Streptomyces sp. NBC_00086]